MSDLIEKAKSYFYSMMTEDYTANSYGLVVNHVPLVEQEMKKCLKRFPEANEEIALLAVRFHDVGYYPLSSEIDHAVRGEERARIFLEKYKVDKEIINQVCHCVRAHRNRDVPPATLEAKLLVFCDNASHLIDSMYINLIKERGEIYVLRKLDKDYEDLALIEGMQEEYNELYTARKVLLTELQKMKE
jgi:hypothetical protein